MKKAVLALILTMAVASQAFADEIDEARELLSKERGGDILFLSKINLGIHGGDNWIADRNDGWTYIYTISDDKKVREAGGIGTVEISEIRYFVSNNTYLDLEYDIMQDIPGIRLGSKAASFGDYNGDGIDEIFFINPYNELRCSIFGYNDEGEAENSFTGHFAFIGPKEPAPVFFANYKGRDGILVHVEYGDTGRYVWVFYVWHEESRKYVMEMTIWADDIDWSMFTIIKNEDEFVKTASINSNNRNESAENENGFDETSPFNASDSGKDSRFIFYVGIAVGVIALALAVFFVVRRKKG
jgi:hypothetical protein